ncbi:hypothetical protein AB3X52_04090 [Nocardioides sp. DS6]|uniref:Uncharacterized protein n=1 Tax=Nocardioides eburneus TaxID=3231482 RepID=A0ABV3SV24_9ACTN
MVSIPARCARCGYTFQPSGGIWIEGATNVTFSNNTVNCPRCGGRAQFIDGTFDVVDGSIAMRSGPAWSWDVVESLRLTLVRIVEDQPEDPVAAVETTNPRIAGMLRRATTGWSRGEIMSLLSLLLSVLSWQGATPADIKQWMTDAEQAVVQLIEQSAQEGPPPGPPTSR